MDHSSFLQTCKSCGEGFAKSVEVCPHCGKKNQSGIMLMVIIGIGCLALAAAFAIPAANNQSSDMQKVVSAPVDTVNVTELVAVLKGKTAPNDPHVIKQAHKITGKMVQWDLEVFVSTNSNSTCQIVTKPTSQVPGALVIVYPLDNHQKKSLQNVRPGDRIRVKGVIKGIQGGRVKIDPAVIL
jgi:uncharacterized protein (DUF983 family)